MDTSTVVSLLDRYGLPVVIIFVLFYSIWKLVGWAGENAVRPMVAAHVKWVNDSTECQKKMTETVGEMKVAIVDLATGQKDTRDKVTYLVDAEKRCDLKERVDALEGKR